VRDICREPLGGEPHLLECCRAGGAAVSLVAAARDVATEQRGYQHEAFFYRGVEEFLDGTVPFVQEGLERGEPVMVSTSEARIQALRGLLGRESDRVRFVDMAALGANPSCIIPAWLDFVRGAAGRPARGIGEPVWPGRRDVEVLESQLHESLLNVALPEDTPLWLRCPYDLAALPEEVIEEAQRSHPLMAGAVESSAVQRTQVFGGATHARSAFEAGLPEPMGVLAAIEFRAGEIRRVRRVVASAAAACGLAMERSSDLQLAVHELAVNSVRHGGGTGRLRIWRESGALVCEVNDSGHVQDPLTGRRSAAADGATGRGLWMVNRLCDLVQLRSTPSGTAVRLHTWI
jgi:anti-sigma regulatory factor (Ser/Thr protein kinase)